ncbi:MAG TPA: endonuclease/exonuclease/phosphatase family protein, partial [Rhodothermales bacterium]
YLGYYVHPHIAWWLQLIAPAVPVLSILVLLGSPIALKWGRRGVRYTHVALLILVLWRFAPDLLGVLRSGGRSLSPGNLPQGALVVMVHNAKWKDGSDDEQTLDLLERLQPHIVAYQEASVRFLDRGIGYSPEVVPAMRLGYGLPPLTRESQRRVNQPILTRLPAESFTEMSLSEPGTQGSSDAARAMLDWNGTQIAFYSVHLRSYLRWGLPRNPGSSTFRRIRNMINAIRADVIARAQEAERLRSLIRTESRPFLIGGDLNATRHNWEYRHLRGGLIDVARASGVLKLGTFPAAFPVLRLDHVFVSRDWKVIGADVGPELTSDHRPLLVAVELRPTERAITQNLTKARP